MTDDSKGLRVFISYARSDASAFAEELLAGLEAAGFDPFLDRHDISAGEPWEARLESLLVQADTVVYVLSPASVRSERCTWEVDRATALSKRLIPVVAIDVAEADTPARLKSLNYVFFSEGHSFGAGLRQLSTALRTDLAWVREHTRLAELADYWTTHARSDDFLLRGSELSDARAWMAGWKPGAPEPTARHREFINDSESAERMREGDERKRLDEMARGQEEVARAQADKAKAQADTDLALRRFNQSTRRWFWVVVAMLVVTAVFAFFLWNTTSQLNDSQANLADAQAQLAEKQERLRQAAESLNSAVTTAASTPAAPTASGTPATAAANAAKLSAVQDLVRKASVDLGWDIDLFYCEGAAATQNRARATLINDLLLAERARQAQSGATAGTGISFPIGRVRVRPLTEEVNARSGYQIQSDVVRAEPSEVAQADALRRFVTAHRGPTLADQRSGQRTAFYLSAFLCGGGQ